MVKAKTVFRNPFTWPVLLSFALSAILLLISYCGLGPQTPTDSVGRDFGRVFTHEAGFAFGVAAIIWLCFEFYKSTKEDDRWNARIEEISQNVFFGVWKKNFPDALIKEAGRLILDQTFIRTDLHLIYTLMDASFQMGHETVQFVKLNTVATCRVRNVSNDTEYLPLGIGLPNPMIDEMKPFCRLNRLSIKRAGVEEPIPQAIWDDAEIKFQKYLTDDKATVAFMELGTIKLAPNEEVEMLLDYNMAKEFEDTEVFTTRFPVDSVSFTITDKGNTKRLVLARSIHTADLQDDTSPEATGTYCFRLMRWLLPEQGFVIWWKNVPDRPGPTEGAS